MGYALPAAPYLESRQARAHELNSLSRRLAGGTSQELRLALRVPALYATTAHFAYPVPVLKLVGLGAVGIEDTDLIRRS